MSIKFQPKPLPQSYKHQNDPRPEPEKNLSTILTRCLSSVNLNRIDQCTLLVLNPSNPFFFVCLTGTPTFNKQYQNLQLPGPRLVYRIKGFFDEGFQHDEEKFVQFYNTASFQKQADSLHAKLGPFYGKYWIVFLFHSFGTVLLCSYFKKYGQICNIAGLIDIAGMSISMYPRLHLPLQTAKLLSPNYLILQSPRALPQIQQLYNIMSFHRKYSHFSDRYMACIYLKYLTDPFVKQLFQCTRKYPNILKCFMMGAKDQILDQTYMSLKIIHYCYDSKENGQLKDKEQEGKMQGKYWQAVQNAYEKINKAKVKNIQQKFVYNFEQGKHSIHMQPKLTKQMNKIINQYMTVIDQTLSILKKEANISINININIGVDRKEDEAWKLVHLGRGGAL